MEFNEIKKKAIKCLENGYYENRTREIGKNLLADKTITECDVINMINSCDGTCYEVQNLYESINIKCHILKPKGKFDGWYIKFFFIDPLMMIISIHQ